MGIAFKQAYVYLENFNSQHCILSHIGKQRERKSHSSAFSPQVFLESSWKARLMLLCRGRQLQTHSFRGSKAGKADVSVHMYTTIFIVFLSMSPTEGFFKMDRKIVLIWTQILLTYYTFLCFE